jgi:hypothetical protein
LPGFPAIDWPVLFQRVLLAEERVVRDDAAAGAPSTPNAMPEARTSLLQIDAAATDI